MLSAIEAVPGRLSKVLGSRVEGWGSRVQGVRFRVCRFRNGGFRVQAFGFSV